MVHTTTVMDVAEQIRSQYFSHIDKGSVFFCALFHYMGNIGDATGDLLVEQEDSWHSRNGFLYKYNDQLRVMPLAERSLWLIKDNNIPISLDEWSAISNFGSSSSVSSKNEYSRFGSMNASDLEVILQTAVRIAIQMEQHAGKKIAKEAEKKMRAAG